MKRKFVKAMAVAISAMLLMSSTLVYADDAAEGGGETSQTEESSSEESSESGSGEEGSDSSGDSGEASHDDDGASQEGNNSDSEGSSENSDSSGQESVHQEPASDVTVPETSVSDTPATEQPATGTEVTEPTAIAEPAATESKTEETVVADPVESDTPVVEESGSSTGAVEEDVVVESSESVEEVSSTEDSDSSEEIKGTAINGSSVKWDEQTVTAFDHITDSNGNKIDSHVAWTLSPDKSTVFIYLDNVVPWGGERSTGNFDIVTDTGRTLVFRITQNGVLCGNDNALLENCIVANTSHGYQAADGSWPWINSFSYEIAIPVDMLPKYNSSIAFGWDAQDLVLDGGNRLVLAEESADTPSAVVTPNMEDFDTTNMNEESYGMWANYPVSRLDYTTNGTQTAVVDGEAALVNANGKLMGYCVSQYTPHINAWDVMDVTLYNRNEKMPLTDYNASDLNFSYAMADENGNLTWLSEGDFQKITDGTVHVYLFATSGWNNSTNLNNLTAGDTLYGEMYAKVSNGVAEMQYWVDAEKFAARYGVEADALGVVGSDYERIGGYATAPVGTSSGPVANAGMCLAACLIGLTLNKKKLVNAVQKARAEA